MQQMVYQRKPNSKHTKIDKVPKPLQSQGRVLEDNRPKPQNQTSGSKLPEGLKSGMEKLSGHDLSDVKVHYGSEQPDKIQAHAFAQGSDIHLAPGQSHHLPHELGHVVQQKQGRVQPTTEVNGVNVNDLAVLESEATEMGQAALQSGAKSQTVADVELTQSSGHSTKTVVAQRMIKTLPSRNSLAPALADKQSIHTNLVNYLYMTKINNRDQTFEQAVMEFVRLNAKQSVTDAVKNHWQSINTCMKQFHQSAHHDTPISQAHTLTDRHNEVMTEARQKADVIINCVNQIATAINQYESDTPAHPNKRGITAQEEQAGTVPQSKRSIEAVDTARRALVTELNKVKVIKGKVYKTRHVNNKGATYYKYTTRATVIPSGISFNNVKTWYRQQTGYSRVTWKNYKPNDVVSESAWDIIRYENYTLDRLKSSFMLGSLVMPSGRVFIGHSGFMADSQFDHMFKPTVERLGFSVTTGRYDDIQQHYQQELAALNFAHHRVQTHAVHSDHTHERGNPAGACAAAQVIGDGGNQIPDETLLPTGNDNNQSLSMTEMYTHATDRAVTVKDNAGHDRSYGGATDVPSCLTCQFQLRATMVKLRQRIKDMDKLESEISDASYDVRDFAKENFDALLLRLEQVKRNQSEPSKKLPSNVLDEAELDLLIRTLKTSVEKEASVYREIRTLALLRIEQQKAKAKNLVFDDTRVASQKTRIETLVPTLLRIDQIKSLIAKVDQEISKNVDQLNQVQN